jgi:hypothetical protein
MLRKILRLATILFFPLLAAHAAGGRDLGPPQGSLSVHLVDGPLSGYQEINLAIQAVQVASKGGWTTLGTPGQTFNLLALTGGVVATLVPGAALPAGRYNQIRLVLGTENSVKLADGSLHPLEVPSGLKSGVKVLVHFRVEPGAARDVWIDFDAPHSIQVTGTGASRKFLLRPVVRAYDKSSTGSVEGTVSATSAWPPS